MSAVNVLATLHGALAGKTHDDDTGRAVDAATDVVLAVLFALRMVDGDHYTESPGEPSVNDYARGVVRFLQKRYDV